MSRAFQKTIEWSRLNLRIEKVVGRTLTSNTQAIQMVKKMGFEITEYGSTETTLIKYLND